MYKLKPIISVFDSIKLYLIKFQAHTSSWLELIQYRYNIFGSKICIYKLVSAAKWCSVSLILSVNVLSTPAVMCSLCRTSQGYFDMCTGGAIDQPTDYLMTDKPGQKWNFLLQQSDKDQTSLAAHIKYILQR